MKRTAHITTILLSTAVALGLCGGCRVNVHLEDYGLSVASVHEDESDSGTAVEDVKVFVFSKVGGALVAKARWEETRGLADTLFRLAPGGYTVLAASNLVSPFSAESASNSSEVEFTVSEAPERNALFGAADVTVEDVSAIITVEVSFRRLLPELEMEFDGFPDGVTVSTTFLNGADAIKTAQKGSDGKFGLPSRQTEELLLGEVALSSQMAGNPVFRLMPTAGGQTASLFRMKLTYPDGRSTECGIEAPVMNIAGRYLMRLNYKDMKSEIRLSPFEINGWTQGWIYSGIISDPD